MLIAELTERHADPDYHGRRTEDTGLGWKSYKSCASEEADAFFDPLWAEPDIDNWVPSESNVPTRRL